MKTIQYVVEQFVPSRPSWLPGSRNATPEYWSRNTICKSLRQGTETLRRYNSGGKQVFRLIQETVIREELKP